MKSDSKVVLDPDLIDLTMIPPPMTPDEVSKSNVVRISTKEKLLVFDF